jgi:hypothetical protein
MIEKHSFGSMTISGKRYTSDLKIINGKVYPDWWREKGHSVDVDEVADILNAKPDYLIIGSGKFGLMKLSDSLRQHLEGIGIQVIVERSKTAVKTYNKMYADGKNAAGGFHLTC